MFGLASGIGGERRLTVEDQSVEVGAYDGFT